MIYGTTEVVPFPSCRLSLSLFCLCPLHFILSIFYCRPRRKCHTLGTGRRFMPVFEDTVRSQSIGWTLSICLLFAISGKAQTQAPSPVPPGRTDAGPANADADESRERLARDLAKKANQSRQALLKADTDKLLKLAVELKDYVDKSNENVLSLDVLKKADEIERLAHSVKDKMKGPN
jgi:hypothetical protein